MSDKYLVTGATGFIGANLVRELIKQKKDVSILVRDKELNWRIKDLAPHLKIYEKDILDPGISSIIKKIKPDYIFHLATYGVYHDQKLLSSLIDINLKGTINIINAAKSIDFKLFINTGSCFEYGAKDMLIKESDILQPISDYGITKSAATMFCQKEAILHELPIITLRPFTGYGYFEDKNRLISSAIFSALKNKPIQISSFNNVRNFTFIEDIVKAYLSALKKKNKPGEIFNIASKEPHTVKDVVQTIIDLTGSKSKVLNLGSKLQHWEMEPKGWAVDISKANKKLGWNPKNDLRSGLEKTLNWHKEFFKL